MIYNESGSELRYADRHTGGLIIALRVSSRARSSLTRELSVCETEPVRSMDCPVIDGSVTKPTVSGSNRSAEDLARSTLHRILRAVPLHWKTCQKVFRKSNDTKHIRRLYDTLPPSCIANRHQSRSEAQFSIEAHIRAHTLGGLCATTLGTKKDRRYPLRISTLPSLGSHYLNMAASRNWRRTVFPTSTNAGCNH